MELTKRDLADYYIQQNKHDKFIIIDETIIGDFRYLIHLTKQKAMNEVKVLLNGYKSDEIKLRETDNGVTICADTGAESTQLECYFGTIVDFNQLLKY